MNQLTLILNVYVVMYVRLKGFNPFLFSSNNNFIDYYSINIIIYIIQ